MKITAWILFVCILLPNLAWSQEQQKQNSILERLEQVEKELQQEKQERQVLKQEIQNLKNFLSLQTSSSIHIGTSHEFNGKDSKILIPNSNAINFQNSFSVSAWIRTKGNVDYQMVVSKHFTHNSRSWDLSLNGTIPRFAIIDKNNTPYLAINQDIKLDINIWYHLVGVYDKPKGRLLLYIDGINKISSDIGICDVMITSVPIIIGAYCDSMDGSVTRSFFNGNIKEVMLFDYALTEQEIYLLTIINKNL